MFDAVKIMGERNSGTNFLQTAVFQNFGAHIHLNADVLPQAQRLECEALRTQPGAYNDCIERNFDALHEAQRGINGGWKHAALHLDAVDRFSHNRSVLFLCITRHPATWLRSMHRTPFHTASPVPADFSDFIRQPWQTRSRDELGGIVLANPMALWGQKNRLMYAASMARKDVQILRYETLVGAFDATLAALPLTKRDVAEMVVPMANARGFLADRTDFNTYKARIAMDPWAGYTDSDKDHILAELDADLMNELNYH